MDNHYYEPRTGHGLRHDPFNAIVGPRPIGWISTRSAGGRNNLAPYSFFNAFNYVPPITGFSSIGYKDTVGIGFSNAIGRPKKGPEKAPGRACCGPKYASLDVCRLAAAGLEGL